MHLHTYCFLFICWRQVFLHLAGIKRLTQQVLTPLKPPCTWGLCGQSFALGLASLRSRGVWGDKELHSVVISSSLLAGLLNSLSLKCLLFLWLVNWAARPQTLRVGFVLPWCLHCCPYPSPPYSLDLQQFSSLHSSNKAKAQRKPRLQPRNFSVLVRRVSDSCPALSVSI